MLGRLALGCFDRLTSFRCRRTIGLRSVHLAPSYGGTETLTHPAENPVSPAAGDGDPRRVMLGTCLRRRETCFADVKTEAESSTSKGGSFRISADLAASPASSFLCYDGEDPDIDPELLVAAHGDSILFGLSRRSSGDSRPWISAQEYFVYRAAAAGRPASVSPPLPTHDFSARFDEAPSHILHDETTGILRRGEDELLVVELGVRNQSDSPSGTIDLNVLHVGSSWDEWERRWAVPVVNVDGSRGFELKQWTGHDRVIPVGDRFLCWVKFSDGFLLCDMADPNLMLRSMPLPVAPREGRRGNGRYVYHEDDDRQMKYCRNLCGVGENELRFVSIDPRCCCGGPGRGTCPNSSFAFTVTTWTMSLSMDERMVWVMDGVLDCEELWDLPGYEGLPCVPPSCPVVSPVNPDVICFTVSNSCLLRSSRDHDQVMVWMLEVDTRRKFLLSLVLCPEEPDDHLPAKFYC